MIHNCEPPDGERLGLLLPERWPAGITCLRVRFLDGDSRVWAQIVDLEMGPDGWSAACGIRFEFVRDGWAEIRVTFEPGSSWSHLGQQCARVPQERPTMRLGWLDAGTPASEVQRVWLHEAGHALGFLHGHQGVITASLPWDWAGFDAWWLAQGADLAEAHAYWDPRTMTDSPDVDHVAFDSDSIMTYWMAPEWFTDRRARGGARKLSREDRRLAASWYGPPRIGWNTVWLPGVER